MAEPIAARDHRICALIGTGRCPSRFRMLCFPALFLACRAGFGVSFARLGAAAAALRRQAGFLVDRSGAEPILVGGALLVALCVSAMPLAPDFGAILLLAALSGVSHSVIRPAVPGRGFAPAPLAVAPLLPLPLPLPVAGAARGLARRRSGHPVAAE